jgi:hypothetical protein
MTNPAFFAVGHKWSAQYGKEEMEILPLFSNDGNTKPVGLACGACLCHSRKSCVNTPPTGTSRSEDGVFMQQRVSEFPERALPTTA